MEQEEFIEKLKQDIYDLYQENHQLQSSNEAKEKEIERLKGLIGYAHQDGFARGQTKNATIEDSWNKFKTENNL